MINKRKYQQGGAIPQGGGIMEKIAQLPQEKQEYIMQAFAQWAQEKGMDIAQIQNNPQAMEQAMTEFLQEMEQRQSTIARHGAKLQYIKDLKGTCPDGTHLEYYKAGGRLCKKCMKNQEGGEMEQEKKGGVLSQYKNKVKKDCGGTKMDKCGGKMKKHQIGGTIETLRESLGLEKKNEVTKAQNGTKVQPRNEWSFDRREQDLGNGHKVMSDWIYQAYRDGTYLGDMSPTVAGRTIYVNPYRNDTVFWRTPDRWTSSTESGGFMPIPDKSRNQPAARNNFYRWVRKTTPFGNNTGEYKLNNQARGRALRGN